MVAVVEVVVDVVPGDVVEEILVVDKDVVVVWVEVGMVVDVDDSIINTLVVVVV
jgi:hypothetical protein